MKVVLDRIDANKSKYTRHPLFQKLDKDLGDENSLAFMRQAAFFIMSFSDLNKYALREEPAKDRWQEIVNAHTKQDDHHWEWYLEDFKQLGWNSTQDAVTTMRWLWSDETCSNRILTGELWALCSSASGLERLVVVEAIEATGEVLFSRLARSAEAFRRRTAGKPLVYFGSNHLAVEQGHSSGSDSVDAGFAALALPAAERDRMMAMVDRVFDLFTAWIDQLFSASPAREAA